MSDCCDPTSYGRLFDDREARRLLRSYRKRGLDDMASRLVAFLTSRGIEAKTVLEVGGGLGDFQIELLKAGAAGTVNVELSDGYEKTASELMEAEGLTDRTQRVVGDFVELQANVDNADVVVLNRVICCYPWMERLVTAAVTKTDWMLALSVPRDHLLGRTFTGVANLMNRLRGCDVRAYLHPVSAVEADATALGLVKVFSETDVVWQGMVFERP